MKQLNKITTANSGSHPMRVSEGFQALVPAYRHLCQRIGTQARNPALAVAEDVGGNMIYEKLNTYET